MDDVARDLDKWKGELKRALSRRGSLQLRLNEAADQYERDAKEYARQLREGSTLLVAPLPVPNALLVNYSEEQQYIRDCVENLKILRVPQAEIDEL